MIAPTLENFAKKNEMDVSKVRKNGPVRKLRSTSKLMIRKLQIRRGSVRWMIQKLEKSE